MMHLEPTQVCTVKTIEYIHYNNAFGLFRTRYKQNFLKLLYED